AMRVRYLDELLPAALRLEAPDVGAAALLFAILAAKGTDIVAFFTGRALGRRKLIPHISPGKTVAGGVGALVAGAVITAAFALLTDLRVVFPWWACAPLGILIGVTAMVGDLVESLIKRSTAVK